MNNFKLSLVCLVVAQAVAGYTVAADYNAAQDGVITSDKNFSATDTVQATIQDTFKAGTVVNFTDQSKLNVSTASGISAGTQNFRNNAQLNASIQNAITGGVQNFGDASQLRVNAANALTGSQINLDGLSSILLKGVDIESNTLGINLVYSGATVLLNDQNATIGKLEGKGLVHFGNDPSQRNTLTIDTSRLGGSTFDGRLLSTGAVNLVKQGSGEWIFNGDGNQAQGKATVDGGLLTVNGDLSKFTINVKQGASLGGTGKVGSTTIASGAGLGAGNSKGVLSVNGDLKMDSGSVLFVSAGPDGKAGTIAVSNTVTLDKNAYVEVMADSGRYAANTRYTLLTAEKGITGQFISAYSDLYFLTAKLIHNANSVELELQRNDKSIISTALNPSAVNAAKVIGDQTPELLDHLLASSSTTAGQALDQLAGAANASRASAMFASTAQVGSTLLNAMNQLNEPSQRLQASLSPNDGPLLVATGTPASARGLHDPQGAGRLWVQGLGSRGSFDGTHQTNDIQQQSNGALLGMDWAAGDAWRLGVAGGYSKTRLDAKDFLTDNLDSYHVGAYARHQDGVVVTRMGLAYSGHSGSSKREVDFSGFRDTPKGSYDASNQQAFVEFALPNSSTSLYKEPFASLGYQRFTREAYDEKGGAAALHVDEQQQGNLVSTLGLRIARQNVLDNGMTLTRRASLGWRYTFGDIAIIGQQAFLSSGETFEVYGAALDRNSVMAQAGVDLGITAAQNLSLNYTGDYGTNARNHGLAAEWRWSF